MDGEMNLDKEEVMIDEWKEIGRRRQDNGR